MSQDLPLEKAYEWFNSRVSSSFSSYRNNANKHIRSINDKVEELKSSAHRFDYSDIKDPDVYQNYATTIFNRTNEIFEDIEIPEEITYVNLEIFVTALKNKVNSYLTFLAKYLSWLKRDRSYKDKVKSLDRSLTRIKEEIHNFESKTMISYAEIIPKEKVLDDIEILTQLVERNNELEEEIDTHADEVEKLTKEVDAHKEKLDELKNHPGFIQLETNKKELEHIEISIANKVSEIKKLCSKVLRASDNKKIDLDNYEKEVMKSLIKDPLTLFIKESEGYRGIKATLQNLKEISIDPAIQMKKEKLQRAFDNIDEIINDNLLENQNRAQFIIKQNEAIHHKFEDMQLFVKIKKYEQEIDNLTIDRNRITLSLRRELEGVEDKIASTSKSVEERIIEFASKEIKLVF
ncbi:MAG: hypothetical protein HeimAB125_09190 [Candidatus Heimdallarchaeota archaeon AB_125]|nr:MAG: hypothetical protein HeimAB125_09190 [Candidatus Heimdallarchaeota archaeon AB_125]